MSERAYDEPRLASTIRRGWHVKRADGTWGLVKSATRNGEWVLVMFEDRSPDQIDSYPINAFYLTRNVAEQMRYAMWEREQRARRIATRRLPGPTPMRLVA